MLVELSDITNTKLAAFVVVVEQKDGVGAWKSIAWLTPFPADQDSAFTVRLAPLESGRVCCALRFGMVPVGDAGLPDDIAVTVTVRPFSD